MQQLQGGGASQVQVVEDHQQRLLGGQAAQEGGHGLERPRRSSSAGARS
jgi:hypothetical protein